MLSLKPPFISINGVSLYPDHEDPLHWYFLRMRPRVSVGAANRKQFRLIKFRSSSGGNGGLLEFDVDLGLDQAERTEVARVLADLLHARGVHGTPVLTPVPCSSGSVKVMMFGRKSGAPVDADSKMAFVKSFAYPTSPALFGDNNAVFSVLLDQDGASLLEATLGDATGDLTPIGVLYELEFEGLRPAYNVTATVKWKEVHEELEKSFKGDFLWVGLDIATKVQKLADAKIIDIKTDLYDDESAAAKEAALAQARNFIFTTFFKPAPPPPPAKDASQWDEAGKLINDVARIGSTFGTSSWGRFTWSNTDLKTIDERSLDLNMSERTTHKQKAYPGAHISDLVARVEDRASLVHTVSLDDDFFKTRALTVGTDVELEAEGIVGIDVEATYGDVVKTARLKPPIAPAVTTEAAVDSGWSALIKDQRMVRDLSVRYTVYFKKSDEKAYLPASLRSEAETVDGNYYTVSPRKLYWIKTVTFEPSQDFPWDRYSRIELHTRYDDAAHGVHAEVVDRLENVDGKRLKIWKVFQRDRNHEDYQYRLVFTEKSGGKRIHVPDAQGSPEAPPFRTASLPFVVIEDPRPGRKKFRVMASSSLDWTVYESVEVTLFYEDKRADVVFDAENKATQVVDLVLKDPELTRVAYEVALFKQGEDTPIRIPRSTTDSFRLTVSAGMKGHQIVAVTPAAGAFAAFDLATIEVDLALDPAGPTKKLSFSAPGETKDYEFDVAAGTSPSFQHRVTYLYKNNLTYEVDWQLVTGSGGRLEIPLIAFPA